MIPTNDTATNEQLIIDIQQAHQTAIAATQMITIVSLVMGIVFIAIGLWIYFKKIKNKPAEGADKPSNLLKTTYMVALLVGALAFLYGLSQLIGLLWDIYS